jgi:hypothetical protein
MMHSSGNNGRKRKNDSDKRGAYRKFDEASSRMRESLLHNCAERVITHSASNGGSCRRGFVKDMVREIHERAPLMGISRDDINNKVRIMKSKREEDERREVSPAIPFHIIRRLPRIYVADVAHDDIVREIRICIHTNPRSFLD